MRVAQEWYCEFKVHTWAWRLAERAVEECLFKLQCENVSIKTKKEPSSCILTIEFTFHAMKSFRARPESVQIHKIESRLVDRIIKVVRETSPNVKVEKLGSIFEEASLSK